jgi:hypothetical protein
MKTSSAVEPRRTPFRLLSVAFLVLVGCGDAGPEPGTPGSSASTPASSADPDTTTIDGVVMGVLDYPAFTFEVPITWSANGAFVTKGSQGVSVWDVGKVPQDPCHWQGTMSDPGPTVDDLVEALATQRYRHATEPTQVTLSGYQGRFLELSVPDDWVVTGDADFEGCDVEPSNGHRDFVSWLGNGEGERYLLVAGQVELVWILDVDGQRLVIDAIYPPDTADADRAELMSVVESLRFTDQAA